MKANLFWPFSLSDLKHHRKKNIWSKPYLGFLSHSQISGALHLTVWLETVRLTDRLICKVCLSCSATLIIGPAALDEATVTDNKHIILHVITVKDLNLHQEKNETLNLINQRFYHRWRATSLWTLLLLLLKHYFYIWKYYFQNWFWVN